MAARGAVVVTGTSSGIGRACALGLAETGFWVFAGVRRDSDGKALAAAAAPGRVTPLRLDVTDAEQIERAVAEVAAAVGDAGLAGLVNNAGVGLAAPVECMRLDQLRRLFDVNVFGVLAVAQAFLPLIRQGRGRIVTTGSAGAWITMPFGSPVCASKHAVRSFNDALRMELSGAGIPVVIVDPGSINADSVDKLEQDADEVVEALGPAGRGRYGAGYRRMLARAIAFARKGSPPEAVGRTVVRAFTARKPRTRYSSGANAWRLITLARFLPNPVLDRFRLAALDLRSAALGRDREQGDQLAGTGG